MSADGKRSGTPDDMWAFTTRNPSLDFQAATMFAAASRALTGYNDDLAARALTQSKRLRQEATELMKKRPQRPMPYARFNNGDISTNLQLYAATKEKQYRDSYEKAIWAALDSNVSFTMQIALDAIPYMDEAYKKKLRPYVVKFNDYVKGFDKENPYGVPIGLGNWAGVNAVLSFGITVNYAHIYYPDIVSKDEVYRVANWLYVFI